MSEVSFLLLLFCSLCVLSQQELMFYNQCCCCCCYCCVFFLFCFVLQLLMYVVLHLNLGSLVFWRFFLYFWFIVHTYTYVCFRLCVFNKIEKQLQQVCTVNKQTNKIMIYDKVFLLFLAQDQLEWEACPLMGGFDFRSYINERKKVRWD